METLQWRARKMVRVGEAREGAKCKMFTVGEAQSTSKGHHPEPTHKLIPRLSQRQPSAPFLAEKISNFIHFINGPFLEEFS